jgi:endogenous inhibitor of DNA gyrase (YacG/DUF329 family)
LLYRNNRALADIEVSSLSMKCPTCDKPIQWQDNPYRPFCSERCRLIDLGAWVNEEYTVPGEQVAIPDEGEGSAPQTSQREE